LSEFAGRKAGLSVGTLSTRTYLRDIGITFSASKGREGGDEKKEMFTRRVGMTLCRSGRFMR